MSKYSISVLADDESIEFESLPVAKITSYPLEKRDYKPYAQASFGINSKSLALRFASFEVNPNSESYIGAVLYPFEDAKIRLDICCSPNGTECYIMREQEKTAVNYKFHPQKGEDLQGVYWGYDIIVAREDLQKISGLNLEVGQTIKGNFYKIQESPKEHYGSFAEVDWKNPFAIDNMAKLNLISY